MSLIPLLTAEASRALADQFLVVDRELWRRNGGSDSFAFEVLRSLYGKNMDWDQCTINGESVLRALRRVNSAVHSTNRTSGGSRWFARVSDEQGGEYCTACGSRNQLEVDHIVPVSRGGDEEDINNLQLLCKSCNAAKRDLAGDLLPSVFLTTVTRSVTPRLRYKRLTLTATRRGVRLLGVCRCGRPSAETELEVRAKPPMAANLANLIVTCNQCTSEEL